MAFESVPIKNEARPNDRVYEAASAPDNEIVAPDGWDGVVSLWKGKSGFKSRALVLALDPNAARFYNRPAGKSPGRYPLRLVDAPRGNPRMESSPMQVQVHTDNHIKGSEELVSKVEGEVRGVIDRFHDQITRVEVHLHDLNGAKKGDHHMRCLMEARVAGYQPLAVSCEAATLDEAVTGAAVKLEHSLEHTIGKLSQHKGRTSFGGEQTI